MIDTEENHATIGQMLSEIDREGIPDLIVWLEKSDFYTAPCSTKYHLAVPGGLAEHSLNVYELLWEKMRRYDLALLEQGDYKLRYETAVICGLCHDLCKVNFYVEDKEPCSPPAYKYLCDLAGKNNFLPPGRDILKNHASILIDWLKNRPLDPVPELLPAYTVKDQFPLGHGEKSVSILQDFIKLTPEEKLAIRWHMAVYDPSIHFDYPNGYAWREAAKIPLVTLLATADFEASQVVEREEAPNESH